VTPEEMALLESHGWEVPVERVLPSVPDVDYQPRPTRRNSKRGRELLSQVQVQVLGDNEDGVG